MRTRLARLLGLGCVSAVLFIGLIPGLSAPAWAVAVYTYTGDDFTAVVSPYTTSDHVTVSMTLSSPLAPNQASQSVTPSAISMQDGVQTLDLSNSTLEVASFSTVSGTIASWDVNLVDTTVSGSGGHPFILTQTSGVGGAAEDAGVDGFGGQGIQHINLPGVWSLVPEPGTATLVAMGLIAIAGVRRRRT